MYELASELTLFQAALLAPDLAQIELHIARQQELCRLLCLEPFTTSSAELISLAREVRRLNRINGMLLRHAQRTLRISSCLLARSAPTYALSSLPAPAQPDSGRR